MNHVPIAIGKKIKKDYEETCDPFLLEIINGGYMPAINY